MTIDPELNLTEEDREWFAKFEGTSIPCFAPRSPEQISLELPLDIEAGIGHDGDEKH
jgi:hypothetical protein